MTFVLFSFFLFYYIKKILKVNKRNFILLQTLEQSHDGPVVLIIDELDKARPEVDSFLLDFLENGRLTTGTDTYEKGKYPIYTFITSNDKREIDEALINRCRKVDVPRPSKELFLEILGLPESHHLEYVYDKCPNFSIRQAKQYLEDLEILGVEIDEDALSQYINLEALEVNSLADIQLLSKLNNGEMEFELPDLERCRMTISSNEDAEPWIEMLKDGNPHNFRLYADENGEGEIYVDVDTVEQLETVCKYIDFDNEGYYGKKYDAWFEYSMSDEEIASENIMWTDNKIQKDGTRLGIKIDGDKIFKIAMNRGSTFVCLDSKNNTLARFLGHERQNMEQEYETDNEYGDEGRDYDD